MHDASFKTGSFTLPGEAGYEDLTIRLAKKWGADTIRDSDGTVLSDSITSLGYDIYSTLCLVRMDNEWAKAHKDCLQQNFLMSFPVVAEGETVTIEPLKGYFRQQFELNTKDDPRKWWQVFDRTVGVEVGQSGWEFDAKTGQVIVKKAVKGHKYTVNFLTVRIWEEISMYNHITNDWGDREHLLEIDPFYPEAQRFILQYLDGWLREHPKTSVVRFTSMFYNFTWFWGDDPKNRYIYNDWADYQMMVSPAALLAFEKAKGYRLTSEDLVNGGLYCCTHNVPSKQYRDWMDFINEFVVSFGGKCIELVHKHGKKAYMFYDDHWVGTEPYGERFKDFRFDGIIKCVFNGFEARKCAGVKGVETHELRLHPYLFPTGLKGEPTFKKGGNPTLDAKKFWINIRRALLREPVDRIGLGGYLHLVEAYPDFVDYIEHVAQEFRMLKSFHADGKPYAALFKVAVLTAWGKLRSWICSGHMTPGLDLNELIESLAGMPVEVEFISFDDIASKGIPDDVKVIINAGRLDSAWSGGDNWKNPKVVEAITGWVKQGGGFIGIAEPSAAKNSSRYFQLADVLGVDRKQGAGKNAAAKGVSTQFIMKDVQGKPDLGAGVDGVCALSGDTTVLAGGAESVQIATHESGKGRAVYFAGHKFSPQNVRLVHRAMFWAAGREKDFGPWTCSNIFTECAYYPRSRKLVVINNSGEKQETSVTDASGKSIKVSVEAHGIQVLTA